MRIENRKRKSVLFEEIGRYCIDISKLVFGGVILAGVMNLNVNNYVLFGVGFVVVSLTAAAGIVFVELSNSKK